MINYKVGDFVYFSTSNADDTKLFTSSGVIINISDEKISILNGSFSNTVYKLLTDSVRPISDKEKIVNEINAYYDGEVESFQSQLRSVKREFYKDEIVLKYTQLKQEILSTAKNMIDIIDDEDFESKLKAICQKKKQLFAIKCEGMNDARKHNGEMKHNIKTLNIQREDRINNLDKSINKLFS